MKLLILTQKINEKDPVLGFFHGWVREFAGTFEVITAVCLEQGEYHLPENVTVLSLGKEKGYSKVRYVWNFFSIIFSQRRNYDAVYVHMNQEYILLGGIFWKLMGKKVYMWRNHHAGSFLTDIAAAFCTKVFCTSKFSYTAKYPKTVLMPVGIDLGTFKPTDSVARVAGSVLSLGRVSPSKRNDLFVDAVIKVHEKNSSLTASVYGDALPRDDEYLRGIKQSVVGRGADRYVSFHQGISNTATPFVYSSHEVFINLSSSGMYDKTIFEAMACGCLVLASNDNLRGNIDDDCILEQGSLEDTVAKLAAILSLSSQEKAAKVEKLQNFARSQSLAGLSHKLLTEMSSVSSLVKSSTRHIA